MKMLKKLPRQACLPQQASTLPTIAAVLLILWGLLGFASRFLPTDGGMFSAGPYLVLILSAASLLLSCRKNQSVGMYRLACLLAAYGCLLAQLQAAAFVALLLFVTSLRLVSNISLQTLPRWMCRPIWALAAMGALAILAVDQVVYLVQHFSLTHLGELVGIAALMVLALSLETRPLAKVQRPRMQAVPKDGSSLFAAAVILLMGALTFAFINTLKLMSSGTVTETIRSTLGGIYALTFGDVWQPLLAYIISMAACLLMLGSNRKKNFAFSVLLLFFMNNPLTLERLFNTAGTGMAAIDTLSSIAPCFVLLLVLISAAGLKWNKPLGKTSRMNLVAMVTAAVLTVSLASNSVSSVRTAIESQKSTIVDAVAQAGSNAVFDAAYNGELNNNTLQAAYDAAYKAVQEAAYDPAFKAAQEVGVKDVTISPEDLAAYAKTVAENVAQDAAEYSMQGTEYDIYEKITDALAAIPKGIAEQEIYGEAPDSLTDLRATVKSDLQNFFNPEFEYNTGRGTVSEMYLAASQAVAPLLFETAFEASYNTVYDGIYTLLNDIAVDTANATLEEYDGTIYLRAADAVLRALPGLVEMIALFLLVMGLSVQPAAQTKTWFRRLLDWCYENVGVKLQKCMKLLGAISLVFGSVGLLAIPLGLLLLPTAPFQVSLVLIGGGIALLIIVALNIIFTYPLFAFAQVSADVHTIRDRAPTVVLPAGAYEETPIQQSAEQSIPAAEEPFNPDDLPEL